MLEKVHGDQDRGNRTGFVATQKGVSQFTKGSGHCVFTLPPPSSEVVQASVDSEDSEVVSEEVTAMVATPTAVQLPAMEAEEGAKGEKVCKRLWQPASSTLLPFRLKENIQWWIKAGAPNQVLDLLQQGILPNWVEPDLKVYPCHRSALEEAQARTLMTEYMEYGAARLLSSQDLMVQPTRFLIPWFLIVKEDKTRLISDCRALNKFLQPPHFRLDNWGEIFPFLRKGMWGAKVDLKHAYFHLQNSPKLKPYMRINIGKDIFQFDSAVFGLNVLPQLFMMVMKVLGKRWREKGHLIFIYLDDILVLGTTKRQAQHSLEEVLHTLEAAGFLVNQKKSSSEPKQVLDHLGFSIDLAKGQLGVPQEKLRTIRRELGKLVSHSTISSRKMACILGTVRSFLTAMPFLRAFTSHMLSFVDLHKINGWDQKHPVPLDLKEEVIKIKDLMHSWEGRQFQGICPVREIHSDSSQEGWGGVDLTENREVQEFWRDQSGLHINIKELQAAIHSLKSLARVGEHVTIAVDNSTAYSYLKKGGGRKFHLNLLMQDLWSWCMTHKIYLHPILVPSEECKADTLSRTPLDRGDYTLHLQTFRRICRQFREWIAPLSEVWDMFSSPGNHKFPKFVCRHPHWQAGKQDALACTLKDIKICYANPPWNCIAKWLHRLWENPHLTCLMITPLWASATWWPLLLKLRVKGSPVVKVQPFQGLFTSSGGNQCPPPSGPWSAHYYQAKASGATSVF